MPYYAPLPSSNSAYHAFTIGSVRFIISDLRSEANDLSIFSDQQKEWLIGELSQSDKFDFVVWVTSKPWIEESNDDALSDAWKGYPADRRELSTIISTMIPKKNLIAISADAHMVAFDDGSNTYYGGDSAENTTPPNQSAIQSFPILQSGPLDRLASFKGGNVISVAFWKLAFYAFFLPQKLIHLIPSPPFNQLGYRSLFRGMYRIQIRKKSSV